MLAFFFYLTLYMRKVLGCSAIQTGAPYVPLCFATGTAAGIAPELRRGSGAAGDCHGRSDRR